MGSGLGWYDAATLAVMLNDCSSLDCPVNTIGGQRTRDSR